MTLTQGISNCSLRNYLKIKFLFSTISHNSFFQNLKGLFSNPLSHWIIPNLSKKTLDHQTAGQSGYWPIVPPYYIEDYRILHLNCPKKQCEPFLTLEHTINGCPLFQDNVLVCFASKEESFFLQKGCFDLQIFLPQSFHRDAILTWTRLSNPVTQLSRLLLRLGQL